jgi:hypothetical protein
MTNIRAYEIRTKVLTRIGQRIEALEYWPRRFGEGVRAENSWSGTLHRLPSERSRLKVQSRPRPLCALSLVFARCGIAKAMMSDACNGVTIRLSQNECVRASPIPHENRSRRNRPLSGSQSDDNDSRTADIRQLARMTQYLLRMRRSGHIRSWCTLLP